MPIVKTLSWPDEAATAAAAQQLAAAMCRAPGPHGPSACLALHGHMGAGKTTFVRHLLRALGVTGRIKSPTYAVVEPYEVTACGQPLQIWHFDFYRLSDPREWEDAGFRDLFASPGLQLCEWPEHAQGVMPMPDLALHIEVDGEGQRHVTLHAHTPRGEGLLA